MLTVDNYSLVWRVQEYLSVAIFVGWPTPPRPLPDFIKPLTVFYFFP